MDVVNWPRGAGRGAIVYVFLRFSREGQWIGWFGRTVVHFVRTGEWDDF
jgi:hypothetical protein